MNERKVIIGPYNLGWIKAANLSLNHSAFLEYLPKVDFESLIYSSLLQCGANKFEVDRIFTDKIPQNEFIRKRFKVAPQKTTKIRNLTYLTFYNILKSKDKVEEMHNIVNFIADLLIAVERKSAIVDFKRIPNAKDLGNKLPIELFIPLQNLLSSFQEISMVTPIPKTSISNEYVEKFREILDSSIFTNYMDKHSLLESRTKVTKSVLESLNEASKNIVKRFSDSLKLKKISISLLLPSAKLIETIWGKLPSSIADLAIKLFLDISREKRVVVYQADNINKELIVARINSYVESRLIEKGLKM